MTPSAVRNFAAPLRLGGRNTHLVLVAAGLTVILLQSRLAAAGEGVVEINHVCATQTGCFVGDTPGYPVRIDGSAGRNYRLTSDLTYPDSGIAILISGANGIRLDLGGFSIVLNSCASTSAENCSVSSGQGSGISATSSYATHISNGKVSGSNGRCIAGGNSAVVSNLIVRWCGSDGIDVGSRSRVVENTVLSVQGAGIDAGTGSLVTANIVSSAVGHGIKMAAGSTATENVIRSSGANGIDASNGAALISRNSIAGNSLRGIFVDTAGSTVSGNTVSANLGDGIRVTQGSHVVDNTSFGNGGNGISAFGSSSVQRNSVRENSGFGLGLSGSAVYRENVISSNDGGTVSNGVDLGANACDSTTSCP